MNKKINSVNNFSFTFNFTWFNTSRVDLLC